MKKLINALAVASLVIFASGCATKRAAISYISTHPKEFAEIAARQFPTKVKSEKIVEVPGPIMWVDCDTVTAPTAATLDGCKVSANAPGATPGAGRRNLVPIQCPPSTVREVIQTDQAAELSAKAEADTYRAAAAKADIRTAEAEQARQQALKWARWLSIAICSYVGLRIFKYYGSKIPILGLLFKIIP